MVDIIAKCLLVWICFVSTLIGLALKSAPASLLTFYQFGPHNDLDVMGIVIDSYTRYVAVALFCIMNSVIRSVETDVLHAWLINSVQDRTVPKLQEVRRIAYGVAIVHSIYYWWDWFIYMNILLAQFDLFLMEMVSSVLTSVITTRMYLHHDPSYQLL